MSNWNLVTCSLENFDRFLAICTFLTKIRKNLQFWKINRSWMGVKTSSATFPKNLSLKFQLKTQKLIKSTSWKAILEQLIFTKIFGAETESNCFNLCGKIMFGLFCYKLTVLFVHKVTADVLKRLPKDMFCLLY